MNLPPAMHLAAVAVTTLYGITAGVGGFMGYHNKGSMPSLIAGGASAVLLLAGAVLVLLGYRWALFVGIVVSLALIGRFVGNLKATEPFDFGTDMGKVTVAMIAGGALVILVSALAFARGMNDETPSLTVRKTMAGDAS